MWNLFKRLWEFISCKRDDVDNTIHFYQYPYESKVNFKRRMWIEKQVAMNAGRC